MRIFIILSLSFVSISSGGQQPENTCFKKDSIFFSNELTGLWELTGDNVTTVTRSNRKLLFTASEIIFYTNDSITGGSAFILKIDSVKRSTTKTKFVSIRMMNTDETWNILFFNTTKKAATIILSTDPGCFCDCPFEIYSKIKTTGPPVNK
ncbi:MAG: hypothetical protein HYX40_05375 [Sphingobacteriales bacterium]|nr:hypothetical protein [Sphingobacteriales bacterium]